VTRDHYLAQVQRHVKFSQKFAISQNYAKGSKCKELGCHGETEWVTDLFLVIFVAYITNLVL
jgi:hypothetical protein